MLLSFITFFFPAAIANSYSFSVGEGPQTLSMVALSQENLIQQNKKGALDLMLKELSTLSAIPHEYSVTSIKRGERKFKNKRAACMLPSVVNQKNKKNHQLIHSTPFAHINHYAFTLHGQAIIQEEVQLHGRVVGILEDNFIAKYATIDEIHGVTIIKVSQLSSLVDMLKKKRIDVAMHSSFELLSIANKHKVSVEYDSTYPIATTALGVTCHKNSLTEHYLKQVNPLFKSFNEKGLTFYIEQSISANQL